ncbi:MAG TPA: hypothetical protein PLD23_17965 [Armatimonadota bacterium]|nr:hypothetical protein [Armatimonadota bacterium]HQK95388.1 hypothetical protein [Armatimonadota bacterium]
MSVVIALAGDTLRSCGRAWILVGLVTVLALAAATTVAVIAHVPAEYMKAAAGLVEQGAVPSLPGDTASDERQTKAAVIQDLTASEYELVMKDTARAAGLRHVVGMGGALLAALIGVLVNETRSGRIGPIVARAIPRRTVVLGQMVGGACALTMATALLAVALMLADAAVVGRAEPRVLPAAGLILPNLMVCLTLVYALATVMHPVGAAGVGLLVCAAVGQIGAIYRSLTAAEVHGLVVDATRLAYRLLPHLGDLKTAAEDYLIEARVHIPIGPAIGTDAIYTLLLTLAACWLFSRRQV